MPKTNVAAIGQDTARAQMLERVAVALKMAKERRFVAVSLDIDDVESLVAMCSANGEAGDKIHEDVFGSFV